MVPDAMIVPLSITRIRSVCLIALIFWLMMMRVWLTSAACRCSMIVRSVEASRAEVTSSRMRISGALRIARAMEIL